MKGEERLQLLRSSQDEAQSRGGLVYNCFDVL